MRKHCQLFKMVLTLLARLSHVSGGALCGAVSRHLVARGHVVALANMAALVAVVTDGAFWEGR